MDSVVVGIKWAQIFVFEQAQLFGLTEAVLQIHFINCVYLDMGFCAFY